MAHLSPDFRAGIFHRDIYGADLCGANLGWLPAIARVAPEDSLVKMVRGMAMPLIVLIIVVAAQMIRMTRAGILNVMNSPYIEMAILKGVKRKRHYFAPCVFQYHRSDRQRDCAEPCLSGVRCGDR